MPGARHRGKTPAPTTVDGTGQANRLHPVSGGPPDRKKLHIRIAGRIGGVAPCEVGGTAKGGWHRAGDPPAPGVGRPARL